MLQKLHFPIKTVINSLQTQKGPETSFQDSVFAEFFDKIFSFIIRHKLAKSH